MINYYDGQMADIMPGNITRNPEVRALSYALQQACQDRKSTRLNSSHIH